MKRFLKVFVPIVLSLSILMGIGWYFFFYDTELTKDMFLSCAEHLESKGNTKLANWFYDRAIEQSSAPDEITISIAKRHLAKKDYTAAEVALNKAILKGCGADVYVTLCYTYIQQDKILDALHLLENISDPVLKQKLNSMRPAAPVPNYAPDTYNTYISVSFDGQGKSVYVNTSGKYPCVTNDLYTDPIQTVEGVNDFRGVAISENGLVSPLGTYQYIIGGVIEVVQFTDPAMESAIRTALQLPENYTIMTNDLWKIRSFTIPQDAVDYSNLEDMTSLESLTINSGAANQMHHLSKITTLKTLTVSNTILSDDDVESIGKLVGLSSLTMESCAITAISSLSNLTGLRYLNINNNAIRDISTLAAMTELEELYMNENALNDLTALSSCINLKTLDISGNKDIPSLTPLSNLTMMCKLDISDSSILDISPLASMTKLQEFHGKNNRISSLDSLQNCLELSVLNVSSNLITDLSALTPLLNLTHLDFSQNQVAALPQWDVSSKLITINGNDNFISDVSPIAGLENLNNILLNNNSELKEIEILIECPNLIEVYVEKTKVSEEEADKLAEPSELHHVIIVHYDYVEIAQE